MRDRDLDGLMGLAEASRGLGVTPNTLKNWAAAGRHGLRFVRVAGRLVLYRADVERIARERQAEREGKRELVNA